MLSLPVQDSTSSFKHRALTGTGLSPIKCQSFVIQTLVKQRYRRLPVKISEQCSIKSCIWISAAPQPMSMSMMSQPTSLVARIKADLIKAHRVYKTMFYLRLYVCSLKLGVLPAGSVPLAYGARGQA